MTGQTGGSCKSTEEVTTLRTSVESLLQIPTKTHPELREGGVGAKSAKNYCTRRQLKWNDRPQEKDCKITGALQYPKISPDMINDWHPYPVKTSVSPYSSPLGTFRLEERLRLSGKNSILMTQINVYIINRVVMGFRIYLCPILLVFWLILVKCGVHLPTSSSKTQMLLLEKTIFHKYWLFC